MTKMRYGETPLEFHARLGVVSLTPTEWDAFVRLVTDAPPHPAALILHMLRPETRARFFANCETNDPIYPEVSQGRHTNEERSR